MGITCDIFRQDGKFPESKDHWKIITNGTDKKPEQLEINIGGIPSGPTFL